MNTLYTLIGPPAIGKSTWIKRFAPHASIISRDDAIERIANEHGLTYDDAYAAPPEGVQEGEFVEGMEKMGKVVPSDLGWRPYDFEVCQSIHRRAVQDLTKLSMRYAKGNDDVVLDMTNMDKRNRALYMPLFKDHRKVAVIFNFKGDDLIAALKKNAQKRSEELAKQGKNKTISGAVIDRMIASYETPEATEGFDDIVNYDNSAHLLGLGEVRAYVYRILREISNSWK